MVPWTDQNRRIGASWELTEKARKAVEEIDPLGAAEEVQIDRRQTIPSEVNPDGASNLNSPSKKKLMSNNAHMK